MAFVDVSPAYRDALARQGLTRPEDFMGLDGVIYSGHPDRNVAAVAVGAGREQLAGFLKKEHRVPWRHRLVSAWSGAGFVSQSYREFLLLRLLRQHGVGCPEPIAAGEDGRGRAFLLLRAAQGAQDLRSFLREQADRPRLRRLVARRLGEAVARMHRAGFDHPDLFSKHILVAWDERAGRADLCFLDWQRSRRRGRLSDAERWRDLAALDATLADDLASLRDRLACLRAYLRHSCRPATSLACAAHAIRRRAARLLRRRRIRELRQRALRPGTQNLIRVGGEALCLTREFRAALQGRAPGYLLPINDGGPGWVRHSRVPVPGPAWAVLVRRSASRPWRWLWSWLRGRTLASPELNQAATLFRLQRYGLTTPTLLAVGQHHWRPWRTESFLLTQPSPATVGLAEWLAGQAGRRLWTAERRRRWQVLRAAGAVLRQMHEAGCYLEHTSKEDLGDLFRVQAEGASPDRSPPCVVLGSATGLCRRHRPSRRCALADLRTIHARLHALGSESDSLRWFLAYVGQRRVTTAARRLLHKATLTA
jgi:tRNA A-37 threonylcarbamoyl transferase component Bud32